MLNKSYAWETLAAKHPKALQLIMNGARLFTLDVHFSAPVTKPFTFSELSFFTLKADINIAYALFRKLADPTAIATAFQRNVGMLCRRPW